MPILEIAIRRLQKSACCEGVIVATTQPSYPYFENIIKDTNALYYIGDEDDVLGRYVEAAGRFGVDTIVRATGDNPLVAIEALEAIVEHHIQTGADLSTYEGLPYGSGVEVIQYSALEKSARETDEPFCREHITQYIYRNEDIFKIERPLSPTKWNMPDLRLTVDTIDDYENVSKIFEKYKDIYIDIDTIVADISKID